MEFRVLEYFLAVVKEESISGAAKFLHLSQPTLSRQLKDMENELGKTLFIRSNRKIKLTEEGLILRKRAEEIIELMKKAQAEINLSDEILAGNIYIGAGETVGVRELIRVFKNLRKEYPLINLHIVSGDKTTVLEDLEHGLIDFALVFGKVDNNRYDGFSLKSVDCFGVMMRKDDPLAEKDIIKPDDLFNKPLILSRQLYKDNNISELLSCDKKKINIVGTYNLLFNGSLMVEEGIGYAICFDNIINVTGDSKLCFRPLSVEIRPKMSLVWKKNQVFTKLSEKFLDNIKNIKD
ncbi:MAG TPA: LysR family transcriptional regulator [Candidatus Butyricicoccus avistercoris]|uniref:LysR family transcriptional regulator n=1 Tax=Candidatus Butyricicoccus avistercoris TaxID=2838518 RepID=A0A9D1TJ89_9FIRM|nr:LysR family transcriptional regulator [Candidatus Butyricicoccus avistercoris]